VKKTLTWSWADCKKLRNYCIKGTKKEVGKNYRKTGAAGDQEGPHFTKASETEKRKKGKTTSIPGKPPRLQALRGHLTDKPKRKANFVRGRVVGRTHGPTVVTGLTANLLRPKKKRTG